MKKILWEIQYLSLPLVSKHCKKCGEKSRFSCSEKFRVNARRRSLDIWLIYNCLNCDTSWNARVYSHISPQSKNGWILSLSSGMLTVCVNSLFLRSLSGINLGVKRKNIIFSPKSLTIYMNLVTILSQH